MKHRKLHEIAKFASGLVLGDFLVGWWMSSAHMLPMVFMGVTITPEFVIPWMIFDVALFIILVHYGWNIGKTPTLSRRSYFMFVGILLGIVALLHFVRLFTGAAVNIAGWDAPLWLSWVGTAVTAYLSYMSFRLAGRE